LQFERRLSPRTLENYRRELRNLAHEAGATDVAKLTTQDIRRFLAQAHAGGATPKTVACMLSAWRGYFRHLQRYGDAAMPNPTDGVRAPKLPRRLPRTLTPDEIASLLAFEDDSVAGVRDRAIYELLYSCGLRISELTGMNLDSLDFKAEEVRVLGKGSKTRIVPVGRMALTAARCWLAVREQMAKPEERALFVGPRGTRIRAATVESRIKARAKVQGIEANVHPHMLRHSFASHLLQSSQNLRAVQEMMGHQSIASTQVYTHLDFAHLAKVYDAAHPRARKKNPPPEQL
jgi:integrase/recombinase XerC